MPGRRVTVTVLALAAAVLALAMLARTDAARTWLVRPPLERPEVGELIAVLAAEAKRPVEGRLAGGFPYAPAVVQARGVRLTVSPEVRIAAATIEKRARDAETPQHSAALGAAYLALGEWDRAVAALQDAVDAVPTQAAFYNDLSVALLARAGATDRPEDWIAALDAASRAIRIDPTRPEQHFNRALALRGLHLGSEEADAWANYPAVDPAGPWSAEAAARLADVRGRARLRPSDPTVFDHQAVRERIEDHLLREWGAAAERGDRSAAHSLLDDAGHLADRLAASGGDAMARDEIALIRHVRESGNRDALQALATGHRLYGEMREQWIANRWAEADTLMATAADFLRRGGSSYWQWTYYVHSAVLSFRQQTDAALRYVQSAPRVKAERRHLHLRGRLAWTEGYLWATLGRFDVARGFLARSVEKFTAAAEYDHLVATHTNLADSEWFLGDRGAAWANLLAAFQHADRRGETRRIEHLELAASIAQDENLLAAALEFRNATVRASRTAVLQADAFLRRARALLRLDDRPAAAADLERAVAALDTFGDSVRREFFASEIDVVRAELFSRGDCARSIRYSDAALPYFRRTQMIWLGSLLKTKAACLQAAGDVMQAHALLREAVAVYESRRASLRSVIDRVRGLELERAAFRDLVTLELVELEDEAAAFATAERARAGGLADAWAGADADQRALPPGVAVVYYESLGDRLAVWVLTRERRVMFTRPIDEQALRGMVDRVRRSVDAGADVAALRPRSASLFDDAVAPALEIADRETSGSASPATVVFVPDGPMYALPFAALPDATGRPLIETRIVAVAPSLRTFLAASRRLEEFDPLDVVAVGDGHDVKTLSLPRLPRADDEAAAIGGLYPRATVLAGSAATKRRFLGARAAVAHFAGHTVLNERYPMLSRMLFTPEPSGIDTGWLLAEDITAPLVAGRHVVVLATCEGAAGRTVEGEGAISVARAFFAAGVPAVVASLWPVDDDLQTLMTTFHRALRTERDPARALRAGQQAILAERGPHTPVRVWGGFIMLGGLRPPIDERKEKSWR
ncbi:MAG TPA: CHAT domain-containing protein [Vicinamibacterales bacterium]|nr:CHAT domain-containing protein [Vicinamibacterales bacterium]